MRARLLFALSVAVLTAGAAQAGPYRAPRDAQGHPDLGGLWSSTALTELERPAAFKTLTVSDEEARAYEQRRPDEFATTDIDVLVLEDCILHRDDQPEWTGPMPDLELD